MYGYEKPAYDRFYEKVSKSLLYGGHSLVVKPLVEENVEPTVPYLPT